MIDSVTFTLRPISGTPNHIIRLRTPEGAVVLVAEIVEFPDGYTVYRMDATGVLAAGLESPESALEFYESWVRETNPIIEGVSE